MWSVSFTPLPYNMKKILLPVIGLSLFIGGIVFAQTVKTFPDVLPTDWFYSDVNNMVSWGVIEGNDDGTFKPSANVNRAELSAMWNRYDKRVLSLVGTGSTTAGTSSTAALEARIKKLEDQINTTSAPMTDREMLLYNASLDYTNKIAESGYKYTNESVFEIYDIIKKLHSSTSYTYTAPTAPTTSTASDCQAIKDYYTSSGFGRSSIMNDALTAAGCDPVQL